MMMNDLMAYTEKNAVTDYNLHHFLNRFWWITTKTIRRHILFYTKIWTQLISIKNRKSRRAFTL